MGLDLSGGLSSILGDLPTSQQILQNVALGGVTTVILSGLKSAAGQDAVDPLHLIFKPPQQQAQPATNSTPATSAVPVPTATQAAFNAMSPASQVQFLQLGGHVI